MNLLLLNPDEPDASGKVIVNDSRLERLFASRRPEVGEILSVGIINGKIGTGKVLSVRDDMIGLETAFTEKPPPPLPVNLIVALPRPKTLKKVLRTAAAMGVKKIYLIESWRVEKSYWQSPLLEPEAIRGQLLLGLEQGVDTVVPEVFVKRRFKPFIEDESPGIIKNTQPLLAIPGAEKICHGPENYPVTLAIGPERGFTEYEIGKFIEAGFNPAGLGPRMLRVETAIAALLGRMI